MFSRMSSGWFDVTKKAFLQFEMTKMLQAPNKTRRAFLVSLLTTYSVLFFAGKTASYHFISTAFWFSRHLQSADRNYCLQRDQPSAAKPTPPVIRSSSLGSYWCAQNVECSSAPPCLSSSVWDIADRSAVIQGRSSPVVNSSTTRITAVQKSALAHPHTNELKDYSVVHDVLTSNRHFL